MLVSHTICFRMLISIVQNSVDDFDRVDIIDIEYNKRLDRQRPCLEGDLTAGSNL